MFEVRWGIVGTGGMAELFARALSQVDGAILRGVASRSLGRAGAFAARFGVQRAYREYGQLLEDQAIDIVYVATRNEFHHGDSLAAIGAGKAVLCEKPFAMNAPEAREVVDAARRRGVFCMEAMWMRCSPVLREVLDMVGAGGVGEPRVVSAQFGFPIRFDPLDRVFAPPGGGALFDYGVYALSFVHALLGRPARISSVARLGPTGVDDQFTALLQYASGCQAVIVASLRSQLGNEASIHGTDAIVDRVAPLWFPRSYRVLLTPSHRREQKDAPTGLSTLPRRAWSRFARVVLRRDGAGQVITRQVANGYAVEAAAVQRCLRAGLLESSEMPLDDTLAVLESMDAIRCAWAAGR